MTHDPHNTTRQIEFARIAALPSSGGRPGLPANDPAQALILAPSGRSLPADADAEQVADAVVATCHAIGATLGPIIGQRGMAALYRRSLHLSAADHPWLGMPVAVEPLMDLARLKVLLMQQSGAEAAAGGAALLNTLHALLALLIGPELTERLLRSGREPPSSGRSALEIVP